MDFTSILKAYLEVGILGLSAVVLIVIFVMLIKRLISSDKAQGEATQKQYTNLLNIITDQNKQLMDKVVQQNEQTVVDIVKQVTTHVPSVDENIRQTQICESIDKCLQEILIETNASRAALVQYHNGGRGVNKQSFLKMSMTNEQVQLGVKPMISEFKDQFRSSIAYFTQQLATTGTCYIKDSEDIKTIDPSLYEFLTSRGIQSKFGIAVKNSDNYVLGFICIEFLDKTKVDEDKIKFVLKDYQHTIQTLLNM